MKKETKKLARYAGLFSLVGILLISLASAWGISSSYWEPDNPLVLMPGDSKDVTLDLQNVAGAPEDISLGVKLVAGAEVATITDEDLIYEVPFGSQDVKVHLSINIPEDAAIGDKFKVSVSFKEVAGDDGGMVQITGAMTKSIPILIGEEVEPVVELAPVEKSFFEENRTLLILLVLVIIVVVYYVLRKKK